MNTKKLILTGACLCVIADGATDKTSFYEILTHSPRQSYTLPIADSLQHLHCGDDLYLPIDSTLERVSRPLKSQAGILGGLSYVWEYGFSFDNSADTSQDVDDNDVSPVAETITSPSEIGAHGGSKDANKDPLTPGVFVVGQEYDSLDYLFYCTQEYPRLDIHLTNQMISSINKYGAKKIGIKLAPRDNTLHVYSHYDFKLMTLLLSLGGDDAWNLIVVSDSKKKLQTFNSQAWLDCVGVLRTMSCDYLELYDTAIDKDALFVSHQERMPGVIALFLQSYVRYHPDVATKPDHAVRYLVCQTIKRETKNLRLAKMGKSIGL